MFIWGFFSLLFALKGNQSPLPDFLMRTFSPKAICYPDFVYTSDPGFVHSPLKHQNSI